jgi:YcaO-like protein with predicted kinase domain
MGITRIADVTGLDRIGVPVVMVMRPNSRGLSVAAGKGLHHLSAKASGVMEALESYHAELITQPLFFQSYREVSRSASVVDPAKLPSVQGSRFTEDFRIPWIEGVDISTEEPILVPVELVHADYTSPFFPGSGCFLSNTNGLASGNVPVEAVLHGLCELIERDAMAINEVSGHEHAKTIDFSDVQDETIQCLLDQMERAGCDLHVEEITTDILVPTFVAYLWGGRPDGTDRVAPARGSGCHPDRATACVRAITEAVQARLTRISGARDDIVHLDFEPLGAHRPMIAQKGSCSKKLKDGVTYQSDTIEGDLTFVLERLRNSGIEQIIAVDLSKEEIGIPVIRMIAPALEGRFDQEGYVPGGRARNVHAG